MHPVFGKCPICGEEMTVTRLECRACGSEISGHFAVGALTRLSAEDLQFVETFVKNRGNAYKVGEELELPYSNVRARLTDIIRAMGYEPGVESREEAVAPAVAPEKRKSILEDLSRGQITADDAIRMLQGEPPA